MWSGEFVDSGDELLEKLTARTLQGEIISFDEWIDAMEELEEVPDVEPTADEIQSASAARNDFFVRLSRAGLSIGNRFRLCEELYIRAANKKNSDLMRLYCEIVCDSGFLLDMDREDRTAEQDACCWLRQSKEVEGLYALLAARKQMSVRFQEVVKQAKKVKNSKVICCANSIEEAGRILRAYAEILPLKAGEDALRDNISALLQTVSASKELTSLKPLFLYRVLTRHMRRLRKDDAPHINLHTLWHYQHYRLEEDNGKNYKTYVRYLSLFEALYDMYAGTPDVDAALCLYGFDHLSNLGTFYRLYPKDKQTLPFGMQLEDVFLTSPFTCFEHGYGDNLMLRESGQSVKALEAFRQDPRRHRVWALERISAYMNRNLIGLTRRFIDGGPDGTKALCSEILQGADLPRAQRPGSEDETALFLAAINGALMDCVDDWAEDYLVRAGKALCGDDVLQKGDDAE